MSEKAEKAVAYLIRRIRDDGETAWLLGFGSEAFRLLTDAHAEVTGQDPEAFRRELWTQCRPVEHRPVVARIPRPRTPQERLDLADRASDEVAEIERAFRTVWRDATAQNAERLCALVEGMVEAVAEEAR